jgi:hypothetical protein
LCDLPLADWLAVFLGDERLEEQVCQLLDPSISTIVIRCIE